MLRKPRILIVEDIPDILNDLQEMFSHPPVDYVRAYGVEGFDASTAASGAEARGHLRKALEEMLPFDVVLLDLALPESPMGKEDRKVGLDLLRALHEEYKWANASIVIESVRTDLPTFIHVLREGVADFVPKPFENEAIFRSVVTAIQKARSRIENDWWRYQHLRGEKWLVVGSCLRVADQMARLISEGAGTLLSETDRLGDMIEEHYQLNLQRDADHPVCASIHQISEGAKELAAACARERAAIKISAKDQEQFPLGEAIREAVEKLRPGLFFRRIKLEISTDPAHTIHSIRQDVTILIQEIVYGAIETSKEGSRLRIETQRSSDGLLLLARVLDEAEPISPEALKHINEGRLVQPASERAWGLTLAKMGALNIGARLQVEPNPTGNVVTLALPLTADDTLAYH